MNYKLSFNRVMQIYKPDLKLATLRSTEAFSTEGLSKTLAVLMLLHCSIVCIKQHVSITIVFETAKFSIK